MSVDRDIGKLEAQVKNVENSITALFKKVDKNNSKREENKNEILEKFDEKITVVSTQHNYEQKQIKEYLLAINATVGAIKKPCSQVTKNTQELADHKEEHSNNLKKAGIVATIITIGWQVARYIWDWLLAVFYYY
jgi:chromosome segregation ATPase